MDTKTGEKVILTSKTLNTRVEVRIPFWHKFKFLCGSRLFVTIGGKIIDVDNKDLSNLNLRLDGMGAVAELNRKGTSHGDQT